jgi:DNA mismatch repair protein MSH5
MERNLIPQDFAFVFTEGGQSYFKSCEVRDLDERIGDLDAYIKDTETLILAELEEEILDFEYQMREIIGELADLDSIFAMAECAIELQYVRPVVVPENCIKIVNGRHPLQEILIESSYKMNSIEVNESRMVNIITGPNFSGKSCYASQVGLLVYMAHIGSFLPCDEARISIVDRIIARFNSPETCSIPQSSFQLDLTQMGQSLRLASDNSLVLIDEFGKGTSPASGIALLTASLRLLLSKRCKVMCKTHFLEVFSLGFLQDGEGIKFCK